VTVGWVRPRALTYIASIASRCFGALVSQDERFRQTNAGNSMANPNARDRAPARTTSRIRAVTLRVGRRGRLAPAHTMKSAFIVPTSS
jgi:hypothetical protein